MKMRLILSAALMGGCALLSARGEQRFASGPKKVSLVELYTSEGCSSCPPAERWLSQFRNDPQLWKTIVPIEFHVTFWDNLGWPDRFAQKRFTEREYNYAHAWKSDSVYTPCFVKDGDEWKPSATITESGADGGLLSATLAEDGRIVIQFESIKPSRAPLQAWVAVLVSDIDSDVKRGENAGHTLRHDFTAIQFLDTKLLPTAQANSTSASLRLPLDETPVSGRAALAIWVTDQDTKTIIQAAGGWIQDRRRANR